MYWHADNLLVSNVACKAKRVAHFGLIWSNEPSRFTNLVRFKTKKSFIGLPREVNEERQKCPNSSQQYCMQIGKEHFSSWKNLIYHPNRRYKKKVLRLSNKFLLAEPEGGVDLISDLQEGERKGPWDRDRKSWCEIYSSRTFPFKTASSCNPLSRSIFLFSYQFLSFYLSYPVSLTHTYFHSHFLTHYISHTFFVFRHFIAHKLILRKI